MNFEQLPPELRNMIFTQRRKLHRHELEEKLVQLSKHSSTNKVLAFTNVEENYTWMRLPLLVKWPSKVDVDQLQCHICGNPIGNGQIADHYIFSKSTGITIYYNHLRCDNAAPATK